MKTLTDHQRGELSYGGPPVAINIGIDLDEMFRDPASPSATALGYYRRHFRSEAEFHGFIGSFVGQEHGSALGERLVW